MLMRFFTFFFFFFNDTATTEIYTLSLHDALPISREVVDSALRAPTAQLPAWTGVDMGAQGYAVVKINRIVERPADDAQAAAAQDRKSTRLNSSHLVISYAVFCLKKKTKHTSHECA